MERYVKCEACNIEIKTVSRESKIEFVLTKERIKDLACVRSIATITKLELEANMNQGFNRNDSEEEFVSWNSKLLMAHTQHDNLQLDLNKCKITVLMTF